MVENTKDKMGRNQHVDKSESPAALAILVISLLVLVVESLSHPVELEEKNIKLRKTLEIEKIKVKKKP